MKIKLHSPIVLLLWFCFLAFLVRVPGTFYGIQPNDPDVKFVVYNYGEMVFLDMVDQFMEQKIQEEDYYPKGFSFQIALVALAAKPFVPILGPNKIIMIGRGLSIIYGVLTVGLIFLMLVHLTANMRLAVLASLFLIFSTRLISTSVFAVADSGLLFWICALMYSSLLYLRTNNKKHLIVIFLSAGLALSLKLSPFVFIPLIYIAIKKQCGWKRMLLALAVLLIIFYLANGGKYTWNNLLLTLQNVYGDNLNARQYNKLVNNTFIYFMTLVVELTLPVFVLSIFGIFKCLKGKFSLVGNSLRDTLFVVIIPIVAQLVVAFFLSYAEGRHILFLYPFLTVMAVFGFICLSDHFSFLTRSRMAVIGGMILLYSVYISIGSLYPLLSDTRPEAAQWILKNIPRQETVSLSPYAVMPNSIYRGYKVTPESSKLKLADARYLVLHRYYYLRFTRSIENPFIEYPKWGEVFHSDKEGFIMIQGILKGQLPYTLLKVFPIRFITPEMVLFNKLVGPIDGIGDLLIFRKDGELPDEVIKRIKE